MGNNMNCENCSGNTRAQMDMRRQKVAMYDRYSREQMMPRTQADCDTCGSARVTTGCDTCDNARTHNACDDCGNASRKRDELYGMPLGMGYVPWHMFGCTYEPMQGLHAGTIFPELEKPFYGRRGYR